MKNSLANTLAAQRGCGLTEGDSLFSKKCLTGYGLYSVCQPIPSPLPFYYLRLFTLIYTARSAIACCSFVGAINSCFNGSN
ncbi:MAG: hypothetical protein LBT46_13805, partial [Planctomycetaceae bacterium]|nr:hypothetical protein [Planctomycetaceae bacterium]